MYVQLCGDFLCVIFVLAFGLSAYSSYKRTELFAERPTIKSQAGNRKNKKKFSGKKSMTKRPAIMQAKIWV